MKCSFLNFSCFFFFFLFFFCSLKWQKLLREIERRAACLNIPTWNKILSAELTRTSSESTPYFQWFFGLIILIRTTISVEHSSPITSRHKMKELEFLLSVVYFHGPIWLCLNSCIIFIFAYDPKMCSLITLFMLFGDIKGNNSIMIWSVFPSYIMFSWSSLFV